MVRPVNGRPFNFCTQPFNQDRWWGSSATEPLVRWWRNSLSVNDSEMEKRAATCYILAPGSAHAAATRFRKSCEYAFMPEGTAKSGILTTDLR